MVVGDFSQETDLLVIGGGPGGYSAAFKAAANGIETTIVEASKALGGVCLHVGCIPSKTLLAIAEMIDMPEHAKEMGLEFAKPKIHLDQVMAWKKKVIDKLVRGLTATAKKLNVQVVPGKARFEDARSVAIDSDGSTQRIRFKRCIIATGSRPVQLRDIQIESPRVVDSTGALAIESIPKNALVVGGGYIGLELGSVLAALGTEVTVVEMLPSLLANCDADLARPLVKRLESAFAEICLETRVTGMKDKKSAVEVTFEGKSPPQRKAFDLVLVAVGRRPNSDQLDLQKAGVQVSQRGFIEVDAQLRTSNQRVYAIGDIIGEPMLAHKAMAEGKALGEMLAGKNSLFDPRCIPAVVFTDPEIAWAGLTEAEAKKAGTPIEVKKMQWVASGRAVAIGRTDGLTKLIFDPQTQRLLGIGLVGPHVGEMIAEGALAIEMGAVATDLAHTIHPHPTVSELVSDTADLMLGGVAAH
jgi:dihydrolipoamide dehydrogenase